MYLPEVISRSSCQAIEDITDPDTIAGLLATSREVREQTQICIRRLVVPPGKGVSPEFVLGLPNVSRVEGPIFITHSSQIRDLSSRIRGNLELVDVREFFSESAIKALPAFIAIRAHLYPTSTVELEVGIDYGVRYSNGHLAITWEYIQVPILERLLNLIGPVRRLDFWGKVKYRGRRYILDEDTLTRINIVSDYIVSAQIPEIGIVDLTILDKVWKKSQGNPSVHTVYLLSKGGKFGFAGEFNDFWTQPLDVHTFYIQNSESIPFLSRFPRLRSVGVIVRQVPIRLSRRSSELTRQRVKQRYERATDLTREEQNFFDQMQQTIHNTLPETQAIPYQEMRLLSGE